MDDKDFIIVAQQEQVQQLVRQVIDMQKLVEKRIVSQNRQNDHKLKYSMVNGISSLIRPSIISTSSLVITRADAITRV